jgi:putative serine protease PepD
MDTSATARARAWLLPGVAVLTVAAAAACTSSVTKTSGSAAASDTAAVPLQDSYEQVVRNVLPSVVQISVGDSTGSGVVYDTKGDIVTNAHVVGDAKTVDVLPASGETYLTANVIGTFTPDDLAVIRVTKDASKLKVAMFGNSQDAAIGEIVLAMGNPLGLTDSVTQGIVSATGRSVSDNGTSGSPLITSAIQTSAAINPGNSGGALVNLADEVIGIPTLAARLPDQGGAAPGIGFAIPSDTVKNIANQLISTGKVTNSGRATLGITAQTSANAQGQGVGVAIIEVTKRGPAAKAGLRAGDIIVGINDTATPTLAALEAQLASMKPGTRVTLRVLRSGSVRVFPATLGSPGSEHSPVHPRGLPAHRRSRGCLDCLG